MLLQYSPGLNLCSISHLGTLESIQDIPSRTRTPGSSSEGEGSTLPTTLLQQSPQLQARPSLKTSHGAQLRFQEWPIPSQFVLHTPLTPAVGIKQAGPQPRENVHIMEAPCGFGTGSNSFMGTERWPQ